MLKLIGEKLGMTQVFGQDGIVIPVTVIKVEPHVVLGYRSVQKDGYQSVILGVGSIRKSAITKPYAGQFKSSPLKNIFEIRNYPQELEIGETISIDQLNEFNYLDISAISKGKGTQGVIKRWGFSGGRASHGSKFHREGGSTGMAATPSKVLKGLKMAGRMGQEKVTIQNLRIVKVNTENNIVLVKGSVPGHNKSLLMLQSAKKKTVQV